MAKVLYLEKGDFILDKIPVSKNKKFKEFELDVWFKYGKVAAGSEHILVTETHRYKVRTGDFHFGGMWQTFFLGVEEI